MCGRTDMNAQQLTNILVAAMMIISVGTVALGIGTSEVAAQQETSISIDTIPDTSVVAGEEFDIHVSGYADCYVGGATIEIFEVDILGENKIGSKSLSQLSLSNSNGNFDTTISTSIENAGDGEAEIQAKVSGSCGTLFVSSSARSSEQKKPIFEADAADPDPEFQGLSDEFRSTLNVHGTAYALDSNTLEPKAEFYEPITPGDELELTIYIKNTGGSTGEFSAIQTQFPNFDSAGDGEHIEIETLESEPFKITSKIAPGDTVYDPDGTTSSATSWQTEVSFDRLNADSVQRLTVSFTPQETGDFPVYVRSTLTDDVAQSGSENQFTEPSFGVSDPDQNYEMEKIIIPVQGDSDGDGIPDEEDQCPTEAEDFDGYQDEDGCPENPDPSVTTEDAQVDEDGSTTLSAEGDDPEGGSLSYSWSLSGPGSLSGSGSSVNYDAPSDIPEDTSATASVTVYEQDSEKSADDTATVDINKLNTPPEANGDSISTTVNTGVSKDFDATDPDGDQLEYSIIDSPSSGSVSISGGSYTYSPNSGFTGDDSFTYRVTDGSGGSDTAQISVSVTDDTAPTPNAGSDKNTRIGNTVSLDGSQSSDNVEITSYEWDIDDDGSYEKSGPTAVHTFRSPGINTVTLRVKDAAGNTATDSIKITVEDKTSPTAAAGGDTSGGVDESITFDGSGSSDNVKITNYEWDIDADGTYEKSGKIISHVFESTGTRTVTLRVTDAAGNSDTDSVIVNIVDAEPPTADAGGDKTGSLGETLTFDAGGSSDNRRIVSYEWDVDGDGTYEKTGKTIVYTFKSPGTNTVTLRVTDAAENSDTDSITVTVADAEQPTADAGSDKTGSLDESLTLDATDSSDNVGIVSYEWDVDGDGTYETTGQRVSKAYSEPGTTTVKLRVEDAAGNADTDTVEVTVEDTTDPNAVTGFDRTVSPGETVQLDGSDSIDNIGVVDYYWDIHEDDGYEETGAKVTTTFTTAGTKTVKLQVRDAAGNTDIDTVAITVENPADTTPPDADAGADKTVTTGGTVTFDGSGSTDNRAIDTYEWDINADGLYEKTGVSVAHTFETAGTTQVALRVTDTAGNTDTDTVTVQVDEPASPTVTAEAGGPYSVTAAGAVELNASASTASDTEIVETHWELLDGPGAVENNTYQAPDTVADDQTVRVQLAITGINGRTDTDRARIDLDQHSDPSDPSPSLNLSNFSVGGTATPTTIDEGTNTTIEAVIQNPTETETTVTTTLLIGQIRTTQATTVGPDSTEPVQFTNVTGNLAADNYTLTLQTQQENVTLRGNLTVRDVATEPPAGSIKHAENLAAAVFSTGDAGEVAAEQLVIAAGTNESLTIGGPTGRTIEIRHPATGRQLTVSPAPDSAVTADAFALDVYAADGTLSDDPALTNLQTGERIPAQIRGDDNIFTDIDGPFADYSLVLRDDGKEVDTTATRQIGIGYPNSFEQNATNGTVTITLPRDDAVSEDWTAEFNLEATAEGGPLVSRDIEHTAQDDVFSVTINSSDIEQGIYDSRITLEKTANESAGFGRLIAIASQDAIVIGDPADIAPTVNVTADAVVTRGSPVQLTAYIKDRVPETAAVTVENSEGEVVFTQNVTRAFQNPGVVSQAVDWAPVNQTGAPLPDDKYTAVVTAEDEFGNEVSATKKIVVDRSPPAIDAVGVVSDPVTTSDDPIVLGANITSAPSDLATVELGLTAEAVAYTQTTTFNSTEITQQSTGDRVEMTVDPATLAAAVGEGNFTVTARATDTAGNTAVVTNDTVTIDTSVTETQARVTGLGTPEAKLRVAADETVSVINATVTVQAADGTTQDRTPDRQDIPDNTGTQFDIPFDATTVDGQDTMFAASVTLEDTAGNTETATLNASVTSYELTDGNAELDPNGTDAAFSLSAASTAADGSRIATVGQTTTPPAGTELAANQIAPMFIDVTDIGLTEAELQNATVRIPVEAIDMKGATAEEFVYFYSPNGSDAYQVLEPEVENRTLVVEVDGFSQLAPGRVDDQPPALSIATDETPSNTTLEVTYSDELSAINASSVAVRVNGTTVTAADGLQVTESNATYSLTGDPAAGTTVSVEVSDEAGNMAQITRTLTNGQTRPSVTELSGLDDTTVANDTEIVELIYEVDPSQLDKGAITLSITANGSTSSVSPVINNGQISYELDVTEGTNYTAKLIAANEAGKTRVTTAFSVARGEQTDNGGAQGGGGAGPMPGNEESSAKIELFEFEDATTVRLSEVPQSGSASINTSGAVIGGPFDLTSVRMQFRFDVPDFRLEITDPRAEAGPAPTLPNEVGTPVGFIEVDAIGANQATVDRTTATVTVDESTIPDGRTTADLTAYQYVDGEWQPLTMNSNGATLTATLATHEAKHIALAVDAGTDSDSGTDANSNTSDNVGGSDETESTEDTDSDETESTEPSSGQSDNQPNYEIPGFGPLTAICALVSLLLYSRVRRQ